MSLGKDSIGKFGEDLAARRLKIVGWSILGRNIRQKFGEIDILARSPDGTLVFVEVKTLQGLGGGMRPEDNLTGPKLRKMRRMAEAFANSNPQLIGSEGWRIDLLAISATGNDSKNWDVAHYTNI